MHFIFQNGKAVLEQGKRDHVYHCNVQFIVKVKTEHFTEMHLLHRLRLVPAEIPFLKGF